MDSSAPLLRNSSRTLAGDHSSYSGLDALHTSGTESPVTSSSNASASSLQSPTPTYPATLKYKDPNLTGCYAGTGGSTIITLTSGDAIYNSPEIIVGAEPQTLSYSCSDFFALDLQAWHIRASFAESPACASYARDVIEWESPPYKPQAPDPVEYVPGVQNGDAHIPFLCCGGCKFAIPAVEVLYWSTTTTYECVHSNATITSYVNSISRSSQIRSLVDTSQSPAAKFAIVDGSTLEFPSLYLAVHGAVSVYDQCGVRGNIHHNPTIAVSPGSLSTISWPGNLVQLAGYPPQTGAYGPAACRTYGVDNGSTFSWLNGLSSWTSSVSYNMGPPYNPILLPPEPLTALDPQWEACTAWDNYGENAYDVFYGLYDPPRALDAAPALVEPSTTSPGPTARQTSPAPQPAASILPTDPRITARPHIDPNPSHTRAGSPDQENPDAGLASFILQPFQKGSTKGIDGPAAPTESIASPTPDPAILSILKAAGVVDPPQIYIVDGITLTGDPIVLGVGSTLLTPGSPPLTVSGHTLSLASAGLIVVDGHTSALASYILSVSPENHNTYNVDGITLTGDPTTLVVGSTTLTPDSQPLTLSGHLLALQSGGLLIVDGQTRRLRSSPPTTDAQTFTISGLVPTQHMNDVIVGSTTLSPGSPPLTISGHALSLATEDGAAIVVVDGYTSTLVPSTSSSGVTGAMSGLGNHDSNIDVFAGAASCHGKDANGVLRAVVLLLVAWELSCLVF